MAGFFAAAAKTPFSTLVIVSEMTGNYNLLLPTLWVCAIAFLLSDEQSIYSFAGREPIAFAGPPGRLCPRGAERPGRRPVHDARREVPCCALAI